MERRSFLRLTSTAVAGGLILPQLGLSANSSAGAKSLEGLCQIPQAAGHVRHGLFQMEAIQQPLLPSWLTLFKRHRFFHNGIDEGNEDLKTFTCKVNGQMFTVGYNGGHCSVILDDVVIEDTDVQSLQSIRVLRGITKVSLDGEQERVMIVLEGNNRCNGETFSADEFLVSDEHLLVDQRDGDSLSIIIDQSS